MHQGLENLPIRFSERPFFVLRYRQSYSHGMVGTAMPAPSSLHRAAPGVGPSSQGGHPFYGRPARKSQGVKLMYLEISEQEGRRVSEGYRVSGKS